jgi:hypothetical protein
MAKILESERARQPACLGPEFTQAKDAPRWLSFLSMVMNSEICLAPAYKKPAHLEAKISKWEENKVGSVVRISRVALGT